MMLANELRQRQFRQGAGVGRHIVPKIKNNSHARNIFWFNFDELQNLVIPVSSMFEKKVKFYVSNDSPSEYFAEYLEKKEDAEIIVINAFEDFTQELADRLPRLKTIITQSSRIDHIKTKKDYALLSIGGSYCAPTIAEKCKFNLDYISNYAKDWRPKVIGIIGMGVLDSAIASKFSSYSVNYFDPYVPESPCARFKPPAEVFRFSDLIVLVCPVNQRTHNIINKTTEMQRKPVIFNLSGEKTCNKSILYHLFEREKIAGFWYDFSDVVEFKGQILLTPHDAWHSADSVYRRHEDTLKILFKILGKKKVEKIWQIAKLAE